MNKIKKYLPLTTALTTALLAINCGPSIQQTEVHSKPGPTRVLDQYDCSSLDLTQKVGFLTSFTDEGERFCYRITSQDEHYYSAIANCDNLGRPLPGHAIVIREFAGPKQGFMQLNAVLEVSGDNVIYLPFYREASGEISAAFPDSGVPDDLEQLFNVGKRKLEQVKNIPAVCKELLEYKPSAQ